MNKSEFINKITAAGINLREIDIYIDEKPQTKYALGVTHDYAGWSLYEADGQKNFYDFFAGGEEEAFLKLEKKMYSRLVGLGYINEDITTEIVMMTKETTGNLLRQTYDMSKREFDLLWNNVSCNMRILNELKYFVINRKFISDKYAYQIEDWTVSKLYQKTRLDEIGCFEFMVSLEMDPLLALQELYHMIYIKIPNIGGDNDEYV